MKRKSRAASAAFPAALAAAVAILCGLAGMPLRADTGKNLVENGGFEEAAADGVPSGWRFNAWKDEKVERGIVARDEGGSAFSMACAQENDLKLIQKIPVSPKALYRISCMAKGKAELRDRKGINLSVLSITDGSDSLLDTGGAWKEIVFYGRAGKKQESFELSLRLGGYFSTNSGEAAFDDVVVEETKRVPPGAKIIDLEPGKSKAASTVPPARSDVGLVFLLIVGAFALWYFLDRSRIAPLLDEGRGERGALAVLALLAIGIRLPFCFGGFGHPTDLPTFKSWADTAASGIFSFYKNATFADYPPGYLYLLSMLGGLRRLFGLGYAHPFYELIIRLPALVADILLGLLIYRRAASRSGKARALLFAAFFVLNPVSAQNSAVWAQADSVFTLLIFLSIEGLSSASPVTAGIFYALSVLVKPQGLIFAPVFICAFFVWKKPKPVLACLGAGIGTLFAGLLPYMITMGPGFPLKLYTGTLGSYPYATVNAANFWALLGRNYGDIKAPLLGLSVAAWGNVAIVLIALASFAFFWSWRRKRKGGGDEEPGLPYFETAAFLIIAVFVLSSKMHERYLYPFVPLALGAAAGRKSLRTLWPVVVASAAHYLNVALIYRLHKAGESIPKAGDAQFLGSAVIVIAAFALWILMARREDPFVRGKPGLPPLPRRFADPAGWSGIAERGGSGEARRDAIGVALLSALCLGLGFIYFAERGAPSSAWKPAIGEEALIDLGEERELSWVSWYSGIGDGSYSLRWSEDGAAYSEPVSLKPALYEWKGIEVSARCRYLRVRADATDAGGAASAPILEMAFWGAEGGAFIANASKGRELVDESVLASRRSTSLNSMYFDEIYHGRTAYEHINSMEPYEWTHPPLGKLIISLGIRAFGMNPFGWRIMGLLSGVLLVPLLYAVARAAIPRGPWALAAAGAYAFDFMRYTQTRIGTVDVYVTFFVLASYALMYRFYLSALDEGKRPDLIALAASGFAFSLGSATKWNAIYAGLGLAAVFFIAFAIFARRSKRAGAIAAVLGVCIASFILLPVAVYVASYIPLIRVPGRDWHSIWAWQKQMLSYHAELKATHAFASPWWQWPAMVRPVWYFKGEGLRAGWASTIAAMGNPLVFWPSFAAAAFALWLSAARKDLRFLPVIAGYVSQYLPWILVPRLTFLYHYFPIVPFGLVCVFYCLRPLGISLNGDASEAPALAKMNRAERRRAAREAAEKETQTESSTGFMRWVAVNWQWVYVAACALFFIVFFPAISGLPVPSIWIRLIRWLPSWTF